MLSLSVAGKSWLHKLPVGPKLLALCLVTLLLLPVDHLVLALLAALSVIALYLSVGLDMAKLGAKRLKPLVFLLGIILLYHVITGRSMEGIVVCSKLFAAVALATLVTMTSRLDDMMAVVERLAAPLRYVGLSPRTLGFAIGLVVRFTPIFLQKGQSLNQAWKARSPKRASPRLMVPLALGALDDADRVAEAVRARGGLTAGPNRPTDQQQGQHISTR